MDDQERARLQEQYPSWHIRHPQNAAFVIAPRRGRPLTSEELYQGLCATLIEDTCERMQESLAAQLEIEKTL
ncbi:hypothetical protein [Spirillospora albida]|uniref:hypothetical protein n=1 Tax=Spirillospora albida TaxID=58123 RepID=UPI0004BEFA8A|nr:hypothetical protein [Spirillospora albida]